MSRSFRYDSDFEHIHRDSKNIKSSKMLRESRKHKREIAVDTVKDAENEEFDEDK